MPAHGTPSERMKLTVFKKLALFLAFILCGLAVFMAGGYLATIPRNTRTIIKIFLPLFFLAVTFVFNRSNRFKACRQIAFAFFTASAAFLVAWLLAGPLMALVNLSPDTMAGLAVTKFADAFLIVAPVILLMKASGRGLDSLYLKKGNLKLGLLIGGITFLAFAVLFLLQAKDRGIGMKQIAAWAPWILVFVFSNAFMEELHFRGLFLGRLEPFLGRGFANLAVAVMFTIVHAPVEYTPDIVPFLAVLFILALAWGAVIQKTESLWGSVLFHAGADLIVIVGILQTFGGGIRTLS